MKNPCAHDGCRRNVKYGSKSGLCREHYLASLPKRRCLTCDATILKHNISGFCKHHRGNSAKRCICCGKKIQRNGVTGKCATCLYPVNLVPVDRRDDYLRMAGKLKDHQAAAEWILAGKPVPPPAPPRPIVTIQSADVIRNVSAELGLKKEMITSPRRHYSLVHARAVISKILHHHGMSYAAIARRLNRDHSSIMNVIENFPEYAAKDARLQRIVNQGIN